NNELVFDESKETMQQLVEIIKSVRQSRLEVDTPFTKAIPIFIQAKNENIKETLLNNSNYIDRFCHPSDMIINTTIDIPKKLMTRIKKIRNKKMKSKNRKKS